MPNYLPSDIGTGWTLGAGVASVEAVRRWVDRWAGAGVVPFGSAFVDVVFAFALGKAAQMAINIQNTKHP